MNGQQTKQTELRSYNLPDSFERQRNTGFTDILAYVTELSHMDRKGFITLSLASFTYRW